MRSIVLLLLLPLLEADGNALAGPPEGAGRGLTQTVFRTAAFVDPAYSTLVNRTGMIFPGATAPFSAEITGQINLNQAATFEFLCNFDGTSLAFVWVDGHMVCHDGKAFNTKIGGFDNPLMVRNRSMGWRPLRIRLMYNGSSADNRADAGAGADVSFSVLWSIDGGGAASIPPSVLAPTLPVLERKRDALQQGMIQGWGSWLHHSILSVVNLPSGMALDIVMCQVSNSSACVTFAAIESKLPAPARPRVGYHAPDRSYVQMFVGLQFQPFNISIEYSYRQNGEARGIDLRLKFISCGTNCSDYYVDILGSFKWYMPGRVDVDSASSTIKLSPFRLGAETLRVLNPGQFRSTNSSLRFVASQGRTLVATTAAPGRDPRSEINAVNVRLDRAREAESKRLGQGLSSDMRDTLYGINGAIMWNLIYTPMENGPLMPVSRSWNSVQNYVTSDFTYTMFDWDNFFASHLAAAVNLTDAAVSNFIQTIKSITADGFVPNIAAAGFKSEDRTEPPVGSKVLEALIEFCGGYSEAGWIAELVIDDLVSWNDWFFRRREYKGLIHLGSTNFEKEIRNITDTDDNKMQSARYESGLDNSPMYDGEFYNNETHSMEMWDVGFSSLVAADSQSIANILRRIGRPDESERFGARADALVKRIREELWSEELGTFVNKFFNGTLIKRVSPTSFYPLMANAATAEQAEQMIASWLFNASRFCISSEGDFSGNTDECYWGLPSISADDPAFPTLGYWRGFVWGPMAMLTYWSLEVAADALDLESARRGKRALALQMQQLMLSQWRENAHICENYNPHRTADTSNGDCTGTQFYHWGGLTGLLSLLEGLE